MSWYVLDSAPKCVGDRLRRHILFENDRKAKSFSNLIQSNMVRSTLLLGGQFHKSSVLTLGAYVQHFIWCKPKHIFLRFKHFWSSLRRQMRPPRIGNRKGNCSWKTKELLRIRNLSLLICKNSKILICQNHLIHKCWVCRCCSKRFSYYIIK